MPMKPSFAFFLRYLRFVLFQNRIMKKRLQSFGYAFRGIGQVVGSEANMKIHKLVGGIVTNTDARNYTGRWVYFDKDARVLANNLDNWENLVL